KRGAGNRFHDGHCATAGAAEPVAVHLSVSGLVSKCHASGFPELAMDARHDFSHQIASPHFPNRVPHHVVLEVARLVSNDNVEFTAVAGAVDSHPALASILIRAANSAELGTIQ